MGSGNGKGNGSGEHKCVFRGNGNGEDPMQKLLNAVERIEAKIDENSEKLDRLCSLGEALADEAMDIRESVNDHKKSIKRLEDRVTALNVRVNDVTP